jgi:hypothetical protein
LISAFAAMLAALKRLAEAYPEAQLQVIALEGRGQDKIRVQAQVTGNVDRSALSESTSINIERCKLCLIKTSKHYW